MKTQLLLFFLLCCLFVKAQNIEVNGLQSGVWEAEKVLVTGDVKVQDSLRILPGTTVLFQGFFQIVVENKAQLKAIGTEMDSITFTIIDTTGFYLFDSGRGGWNGIRLNRAGACKLDYCRFQYGKAALDEDQDGGALRIFNCDDVEISHSTLFYNFSREHGGALNAEDSKVTMHDCKIYNNLTYTKLDTVYYMYGGGLRFLKCEVDISTTDFRYNSGLSAIGGALSLDSCTVKINRCRFEHNFGINGGGLYLIRCYDNPCSITNSLFANNTSEHFGGGLAISDSSPLISNLTVANNNSIGVNCGGIFFYQYSAPELWNCIIYGNTNGVLLEEPVQMWAWTFEDYAPEFHNCLVQYGFENISNHEVITVYEDCIDADPLFKEDPLFGDDYYLILFDSPCFNAGSPDTPTEVLEGLDLGGQPRVYGGVVDIGAYEFDPTGVQETTQNECLIHIVGNPITASSYAEIELGNACDLSAKVYSIDGKLLVEKDLRNVQAGINHIEIGELFLSLAQGTYLLVLRSSHQMFATKVMK